MNIQIKRAIVDDVPLVAPLFDAYRAFYEQKSDPTLAASFLRDRLSNHESILFFATNIYENTLGFVQLYPSFSSVSAQRLWIVNDLFVAESARGQGIAKLLMNRAKEFAIETQAKGLFLETAANNLGGQALYQSLGYQRNSEFYYFLEV